MHFQQAQNQPSLPHSYMTSTPARPHLAIALSGGAKTILYLFALNLVLPVFSIPLINLSITAPLFGLLLAELYRRNRFIFRNYMGWIGLAYAFWFGVLFSLLVNGMFGGVVFRTSDVYSVLQLTFWLLVFVSTCVLVAHLERRDLILLAQVLGTAVLVLAWIRLGEAVFDGRWGAWTRPRFLTQNSYGWYFSTFTPFAAYLLFTVRGLKRLPVVISLGVLVIVLLGNGSRSSWFGVFAGLLLFTALPLRTKGGRRIAPVVISMVLAIAAVISILPQEVMEPIVSRSETLADVEDDKTFLIRQFLVQKGLNMFAQSPILGAGYLRFQETWVDVDVTVPYFDVITVNRFSQHNSYVPVLAETGLVGAIPLFLLIAMLAARGLLASLRASRSGELWALPIYAGFVGMSIHLWSLASLQTTAVWFMYGMLAGVIVRNRLHQDVAASPRSWQHG